MPIIRICRIPACVGQSSCALSWWLRGLPGQADALIGLLDPDATAIADGGGLASAVARPVEGSEHIARGCVDFADRSPGLKILERAVNGQPGLVAQ